MITFQRPDALNKFGSLTLLGYAILLRRLSIFPFTILVTNRCNSQCLICNIWKKKPKIDLSVEIIRKILNDKVVTRRTFFVLTGGELLLHPKYEEILFLFRERNYVLLTNALLVDRLIKAVRKFRIKRFSISLDGPRETYKRVRGIDGYSSVEKVVRELKDETNISIDYNINPWNSRKDLKHVMEFCRKYRINFGAGYYSDMEYFEIERPPGHLYYVGDLIDHPYHQLYHEWVTGNLKMPCISIFARPSVRPNGDVVLCDQREIVLGNLHEKSLGEIWSSKKTLAVQRQYISCNECWSDCARLFDLEFFSWIKPFIPRHILQKTFPTYDWAKIYRCLG